MSMGVLVQQDCPAGQKRDVLPIPKKKWIKDYLTFEGLQKGFPDLPNNSSSSVILPSPNQNGFVNHHSVVPNNGVHFVSPPHYTTTNNNNNNTSSKTTHPTSTSAILPRVPEQVNGFKISDHSYRRINSLSQSPTFDFNGGTNRMTKNNNSSLNNRNSGTREVHNKLEKNRRAHLKECFELLKSQLPAFEDRKISNLAILRSSLRHIQSLKRKEREYEHEMERLAREKITLQQRLSTMKKDMLSKWDHLDWQSMVPDELDIDGSNGVDKMPVDNHHHHHHHRSESDSRSPTSDLHKMSKSETELDDSVDGDSLRMNNCHIGDKQQQHLTVKKMFGQINGVNGISTAGPISLVTAPKLSSSPLAAITVEKTANSPIGGASYVNSGKGFSVLNNGTPLGSNGQYYDSREDMCK